MKHPTYGGLKKLQEYFAAEGFPLEVCRGEIFADTHHSRNRWQPVQASFMLAGVVLDLKEKAEKEPLKKVRDISLTNENNLYQLVFHGTSKNAAAPDDFKNSFAFVHACTPNESRESQYFRLFVMQRRRVIENIAWCGLPSFTIPEFYNFHFNHERYVEQVFPS